MTEGHNGVAADLLRSYIDRILRLKAEQDDLGQDIRDIYAEAKGNGLDKTVLGKVVAHLRTVTKKGVGWVEESDAIFDLYLSTYKGEAGVPHAHAREAVEAEAETPDHTEVGKIIEDIKAGRIVVEAQGLPDHDPETGEITESESGDVSGHTVDADRTPPPGAGADADQEPITQSVDGNSVASSPLAGVGADENQPPIQASAPDHDEPLAADGRSIGEDIPDFLRRDGGGA